MEYSTISASNPALLEDIVNEQIPNGWIPLGGICFGNDKYIQAVIKSEEKSKTIHRPVSITKEVYQGRVKEWKEAFAVSPEVKNFETAYPIVNIQKELNQAALWLYTNTSKRKKNFDRFFSNWCSRVQEKGIQIGGKSQNNTLEKL